MGAKMGILKMYLNLLEKLESLPTKVFCWIHSFRDTNGGPLKNLLYTKGSS